MKTIKFFAMMVAMLAMCMSMSSCKDDEDDPTEEPEPTEFSLVGTTWSFIESFEEKEDGELVEYTYKYVLKFTSSKSAKYVVSETVKIGKESMTYDSTYDYSYRYSDNLVIFTPEDPNLYHLEGTIISNIKMIVINSDGGSVGTFYLED